MYSQMYPALNEKFGFDNFEIIAETLDKYFPTLFNLEAIESQAKQSISKGSYIEFFTLCMGHFSKLYTSEEITNKLYELLLSDITIRDCFLEKMLFVPEVDKQASRQLAFLEKTATGELKVAEPVTFLDMLRVTYNLQNRPDRNMIAVLNLGSIQASEAEQLKKNNRALMINFNRDVKGTAKWGVVDLTKGKPQVYCETPLLEAEKKELEEKLGSKFEEVSADKADSLPSTGYTAIAWLDQNITKFWNFDTTNDFNALLASYTLAQFRGDSTGIRYSFSDKEYDMYVSKNLQYVLKTHDDAPGMWQGYALIKLASFAMLGEMRGLIIPLNDLAKVIEASGQTRLDKKQFSDCVAKSYRTNIPRFSHTMGDYKSPQILWETDQEIKLTIPERIDTEYLRTTHRSSCSKTNTNSDLLKFLNSDSNMYGITDQEAASGMILTVFRARAKKREITIHLPNKFSLNQKDRDFIIDLIQDNAYVTELKTNDNYSLKAIEEQLLPVFARNRWLATSGYLPPMVDNYWQRAAKFWLLHLSQQTTLLSDRREHDLFKRCVSEMGVKGLEAVLQLLQDEESREFLDGIFGKNKPAFYAACQPNETKDYLECLYQHLRKKESFPFSELGLSYNRFCDPTYIELINLINVSEQFERLVFTDCLQNPQVFKAFLQRLTREAHGNKWVGLIVVPQLEEKDAVSESHRTLRAIYDNLNNVILRNRHLRTSEPVIAKIKASSNFKDEPVAREDMPRVDIRQPIEMISIDNVYREIDKHQNKKWPLKRGGVVQLQLQQQQQIQQNRQIQQEQQKIHMQVLEEIISGERVTYHNIEALLGDFYKNFAAENDYDRRHAALFQRGSESLLQGYFRTWINAEPNVDAPQVIRSITLDAAKVLLRNQARFTSGLSLENLPKGFYTQRAKDGSLVLCHNPELGFINGSNPFTVMLGLKAPVAEAWEGDFRLLDDKYIDRFTALDDSGFQNMVLFAMLQPPRDYSAEFNSFCQANLRARQIIGLDSKKVTDHWLVFLQAWKVESLDGVDKFLRIPEDKLYLSEFNANKLFFKNQSTQLQEWIAGSKFTKEHLRAIGQVYYRYGNEVMTLLLQKFRQIDLVLGHEFFEQFNKTVLGHSNNYDCFISERFFEAMDDMIATLRTNKAAGTRHVWLIISDMHMNTVHWEQIESLWRAFEYFLAEITELGLELVGDEFDGVKPENMLVSMDRILETLKRIPGQAEKARFFRSLSTMQLTHGGVHYAIQHEGFRYFDKNLELFDFKHGLPTYAPNLEKLYQWTEAESHINLLRTLASRSQFSHQDYQYLAEQLGLADRDAKNKLVLLLFTQYDARNVPAELEKIGKLDPVFINQMAQVLHHAVYNVGNQNIQVSLDALVMLAKEYQRTPHIAKEVDGLSVRYPQGTFLEAMSIVDNTGRWAKDFRRLTDMFMQDNKAPADCPEHLFRDAYKLAALFACYDVKEVAKFHNLVAKTSPVVKNELRLLINQILSIDYEISELPNLLNTQNWKSLLDSVEAMQADRAHTAKYRIDLIEKLTTQGIQFKYSKSGEFRTLKDTGADRPESMGFFVDHQARLWQFMLDHIAVPSNGDAKEALLPIVQFFKRLQMNRTYLNEIEPLLSTLEKTKKGEYWTASMFYQMLKALQPEDQQTSFPISLIKVVLNDVTLGAKPIDSVEKEFPQPLIAPLQAILKNTVFNRGQQSVLCELALKEYGWQKTNKLLGDIIQLLTPEARAESRNYALQILTMSKNIVELENRIEKTRWLVEHGTHHEAVTANWTKTTALWLKALSTRQREDELFAKIRNLPGISEDKQALVLHIIAWSSLNQGLRDTETWEYELAKLAPKLIDQLTSMTEGELDQIAACYPNQPCPGADDIVRILKNRRKTGSPLADCIAEFLRNPHTEPRMDYRMVAKTREADLQRMLSETRITKGQDKVPMDAAQTARTSLIFAELKQLQAGTAFIQGFDKPVDQMTRAELAQAFQAVSKLAIARPDNDRLRAQIWAILFQGLSHTTRKYPHLAQQFALIVNDICVNADTRVLKLATGEGKSHFVALRAAKYAGLGKTVDICTAKRTLAERDLEDYQGFFDFFGLTSSYIHPLSAGDTYQKTQIHYSTAGDMSLFMDEQSFAGHPITIEMEKRVGLFDEYDFIRFEEGRKTEYNYARPTGRTPKQMTWFYQAINKFYLDNQRAILASRGEITTDTLKHTALALQKVAGEDEEKQSLVNSLLRDPLQLVRWLQSAHEAHELKFGVGFTVREENIVVGDTSYPMREIIPLSSDNQKMAGSTFSGGVQQLLAVRLNTEARLRNEPQNYHIHPESNIISSQVASQRMKQLWGHWEGFSGTISASQAETLHEQHGTEVLHVTTNQYDLRTWHKPGFYQNKVKRLDALVQQIRLCLENRQSMLFSCKNDAQVLQLKTELKDVLLEEELASFIFYTNEDELSANDVLSKKQTLEHWQGGQKKHAVGLIASGFGRGDNVGVEAVFLFDVNDINDLLQKGGRTARNGEEGEVFQFYLTNELQEEERKLVEVLENTKGVFIDSLKDILQKVEGGNEGEKTFERVMLLREYVFSLQNAANQGYHEGLAQLSSWGMGLISQFDDPVQAQEFVTSVTMGIKHLEKLWIDISSNSETTADEKVRSIEKMILVDAGRLQELCHEALKETVGEILPLQLRFYPDIQLKMVLETNTATTSAGKDLAIVGTVLASLTITPKDEPHLRLIPDLMQELATNDVLLSLFARQVQGCKTILDFYSELNFSVQKIRKPSAGLQAIEKSITEEFAADVLLDNVSPQLRKSFVTAMLHLNSDITEAIIKSLGKPGILSNEQRVQAALPVVDYLSRFTENQQLQWGLEYANNLDKLIREDASRLSLMFFGKAMSYRHATSLWQLARVHTTEKDLSESLGLLQTAIADAPEQRLRLLGRAEVLATFLDGKDGTEFLSNFSTVMTQFTEGKDWDIFVKLVEKTQSFWNKDRHGNNRQELQLLWRRLAANALQLPALAKIFTDSFALDGKAWFEFLSPFMSLPSQVIVTHQQVLQTIFQHVLQQDYSKKDRLEMFAQLNKVLPGRQHMLSLEHFQALVTLAPHTDLLNEFLGFEIALPASLGSKVSPEMRELLSYRVLACFKGHDFYTRMSVDERRQCFEAFNLLTSSSGEDVDIVSLLKDFSRFVVRFVQDLQSAPSSITLVKGVCWYLNFVKNNPSSDARRHLNKLIKHLPDGLRIENLVEEFESHTPDSREAEKLFNLATIENLTALEFSSSCQNLSTFNILLAQIHSFGAEETELLHDKLITLPTSRLKKLSTLITGFHAEIKANPSVLNIILDYGHSGTLPEKRMLYVAELLLQAGQKSIGSDRIANLKQGFDKVIACKLLDPVFMARCQQLVNFDRLLADITAFDETHKNNLWVGVQNLDPDLIHIMLASTELYRADVLVNPDILAKLIGIARHKNISAGQMQFLAELLFNTIGKKTQLEGQIKSFAKLLHKILDNMFNGEFNANCQYLGNSYALITQCMQFDALEKSRLLQRLEQLGYQKFTLMLELISKYAEDIKANPHLLLIMLEYGDKYGTSLAHVKLLTSILFKAASGKAKSDEAITHLKEGVDRFLNSDEKTLQRLRDLMERNPDRAEELLFDNVATYLEKHVAEGERNKVKGVVDFFYELAIKERGTPDLMFNLEEKRLQEMFDFDNRQKDKRDQRIIWMHLLHHDAFVTGKMRGAGHDGHQYQWDSRQNQQLLQSSLNLYVARCQQVLKNKPQADTDLNRDLTVAQQTELLQLSDELSIIGKPKLTLSAPEQVKSMKGSLEKLISNYNACWFKTESRKQQIVDLQDAINQLLPEEGNMDRYKHVYSAINRARIIAMRDDSEENATRFLKLNRGGQSRYLNTLNHMQDMVLRHWSQDVQALQSFQKFKRLSREEFFDITRQLANALQENDRENHQPFEERRGMKKLTTFFVSTATCDKHAELYRKVRNFNQRNIEWLQQKDLEQLLVDLRTDMHSLPGHVQTLVNEVLNRGDALAIYAGMETEHSAKAILLR